jgi:type III pantothenate kinase
MILVMDIGNSAAKVGLWDGTNVVRAGRLTDPGALADFLGGAHVQASGAVSVVPAHNAAWDAAVHSAVDHEASSAAGSGALRFFDHRSEWPVRIGYRTPETLGTDRIAAAVGGWLDPDRPPGTTTVVVDAGTALTFEIITPDGGYPGGIIAPGPELLRRALNEGTAQLPLVPLESPPDTVGGSTVEAMQSGIMLGFQALVEGLLRDLDARHGPLYVVATGGWADWLAARVSGIDRVRPHLVLRGVAEMMDFQIRR